MQTQSAKAPSLISVIVAFATVYLVWGSTYFFIQRALTGFPPFFLGTFRFLSSGLLMAAWCLVNREKLFDWAAMKPAIISGLLLLFVGNGVVIWVEQFLPSGMVAIMVSSSPLWFVLLDQPKWSENLRNKSTVIGLLIGMVGVGLLFSERLAGTFSNMGNTRDIIATGLLVVGAASWAGGSLYSKYKSVGKSATVNSTWQMLTAGVAFLPASLLAGEHEKINFSGIPATAWGSVLYLIIFGSIVGYSAYVWLLKVQPATKVSTYAYVNPVVAVLLGIFFAGEHISPIQMLGLAIILGSVLLINLRQYRKPRKQVLTGA